MSASPDTVEPSAAQWALARMLDAAFDDKEIGGRCVELALKQASRLTIPESIEDMLAFCRDYLLPPLAEELGPRLVQALFDDLQSELTKLRKSNVRVTAPRPMKSSVPRLTIPPITELPRALPTIHSPAPNDDTAVRKVIAIVEGDRWKRATIARVLVQAGYDVLPLDSEAELVTATVDVVIFVGVASAIAGAKCLAIAPNASSTQITEAVRQLL